MTTRYFRAGPEAAGGLGELTEVDRQVFPPRVTKLHYVFDGWLGDELLTTFPCFIASERVVTVLSEMGVTGYSVAPAIITVSDAFKELLPDVQLPHFVWLRVSGEPGLDDLGLAAPAALVVSARVLAALQQIDLRHCDVSLWERPSGEWTSSGTAR